VKKLHPAILSIASGLLLAAAWPPLPATLLIFIAFVPLFIILEKNLRRFVFLSWVLMAMLIWNSLTTWWMWNSTAAGAASAIVVNSLFMCLPFLALYNIRKRLGNGYGYAGFICCFICFEYIHLHWELSWPWLTLGNIFAAHPRWVIWYAFTGTSGGSCWVLVLNVALFKVLMTAGRQQQIRQLSAAVAAIVLPIFLSFVLLGYYQRQDSVSAGEQYRNIVIVQPNIDPYIKFETGTQEAQLAKLIRLSETAIDSNTALVIWPETAINLPNGIEEDSIRKNYFLHPLWPFLKSHPQLKLIAGIEGYRMYNEETKTATARKIPDTKIWYDAFNTAALLDSTGIITRYHKTRLVPGPEMLPSFLNFMGPVFEKFGGTTGGYAGQKERTVLAHTASGYTVAPAICYESIYGEFMTGFIRNGANIICVITNDGWWGNTAGHKQHLAYAKLRAIESRRWVVRSANTGISAIIDPYGNIIQSLPWDSAGVLKMAVPRQQQMSCYVRFGDVLSKLFIGLAILVLGYSTYRYWRLRKIKI
jgi:apolipoprotein N-acyltransferase